MVQHAELARLEEARTVKTPWKRWGPYLSERQWGTVREDYSHDGNAWDYFTHDQARSRAYHWGEDGLAGIEKSSFRLPSDRQFHRLCEPELEQRFAGNRELLPLLGSGDGGSSASTGEHANPSSLSSSCNPADERTQSRATDNLSRCLRAFSASFDLIGTG